MQHWIIVLATELTVRIRDHERSTGYVPRTLTLSYRSNSTGATRSRACTMPPITRTRKSSSIPRASSEVIHNDNNDNDDDDVEDDDEFQENNDNTVGHTRQKSLASSISIDALSVDDRVFMDRMVENTVSTLRNITDAFPCSFLALVATNFSPSVNQGTLIDRFCVRKEETMTCSNISTHSTDQKLTRPIGQKKDISAFFQPVPRVDTPSALPLPSTPTMSAVRVTSSGMSKRICSRCHEQVSTASFREHMDGHMALDLHNQLNCSTTLKRQPSAISHKLTKRNKHT